MPALLMTAAEIAAAEALAAEILIAQQATAATAATAEAAQIAQAAQAAQATTQAAQAAQATTQAAQATQASTSGMQALAQEVGTTVQPTGLETLTQAPLQATTPASELEQIRQAASGAQNLVDTSVKIADVASSSPVNVEFANTATTVEPTGIQQIVDAKNFPGSATNPLTTPPVASSIPPAPNIVPPGAEYIPPSNFGSAGQSSMLNSSATLDFGKGSGANLGKGSVGQVTSSVPSAGGPGTGYQGNVIQIGGETNATPYTDAELKTMSDQSQGQGSGLQGLLDKGMAYAEKHPITTGLGVMSAYNMLNQPEPYKREKYKSTFDSSTYRPYEPTPPDPYRPQYPQYAQGGLADLGGYSDYAHGGRMLKGPGDGMSDDIPATIADKQPARLANEEFVIPADVVSHLGNGSSEAGAKALYKMMDRVRRARTGNKKQGKQINPEKYLA
jgi:hypothetical protein